MIALCVIVGYVVLLLLMKSNRAPELANTSSWNKCVELTESAIWTGESVGPLLEDRRSVTWAHYPYRYMLTEYAAYEKRLLRRQHLAPKLFELSLLSAMRKDTGMHEYTRYFIPQTEQNITVLHSQIDFNSPQTGIQLKENVDFTLDNGLGAPSSEDIFELHNILDNAYQDGVANYIKH